MNSEEANRAMDDMADWGVNNVQRLTAGQVTPMNNRQCYTALQQSLEHYRNAGRMSPLQMKRQHLLLRAEFLKAEAAEMFGEQWEAFALECWEGDGERIHRTRESDVSAAMAAWAAWDAEGHKLYGQLLYRAECAEIDAGNCV